MLSSTQPRTTTRRDALEMDGARTAADRSAPPRPAASSRSHSRWRRTLVFAGNFLRHPLAVGTLFQSSRALVRRLAEGTRWQRASAVVELGPGVGTVTQALLERLPTEARLLAIETNERFVAELRREMDDPRLIAVHGDATALPQHLDRHGLAQVDVVISGIPFSTMPRSARSAVLDAAVQALRDDGELLIYQHSRLIEPLLRERFADVQRETEWRSLVPMRVFRCRTPLRGRAQA